MLPSFLSSQYLNSEGVLRSVEVQTYHPVSAGVTVIRPQAGCWWKGEVAAPTGP